MARPRSKDGPARVFAVRLPDVVLEQLQARAESAGEAPATLARELIERGLRGDHAAEPAVAYSPSMVRPVAGHLLTALVPGLAEACANWNVKRLTLFGSFACGDARADSDVDFSVEFLPVEDAKGFEVLLGLKEELERIFQRKVDLIDRAALRNPYVRRSIEKTEIVLYES